VPVSPYQHFALTGFALRERLAEQAGVRAVCYDGAGQRISEIFDASPVGSDSGWGGFSTVFPVPEGAANVELYLGSRGFQTWIRYDDLRLHTEQLYSPDRPHGEPPLLSGGAALTTGGITLLGGAKARFLTATGRTGEQYFVAGRYAAASDTTLTLIDEWLPRAVDGSTVSHTIILPLAAGTGAFLADFLRSDAQAPGISAITISAHGPGTVALEPVWRGFAKVEPRVLTVGHASPDQGARFTAAVPYGLTTATVDILNEGGVVQASPPVAQFGSSIRASWDGNGATSGNYTVRFGMTLVGGVDVELTRPLTLVRDDSSATSTRPLRPLQFVRGAYVFVFFENDPGRINVAVRLAREDGFNLAFVHCRLNQLSAVRAAAEAHALPFVPVVNEPQQLFGAYLRRDWFSRDDITTRLRQWLAPVLESPYFLGVYVADEPVGDAALEINRRFNLAIEQDGALGQGFSIWTTDATTASLVSVAPPVAVVDVYPFRSTVFSDFSTALLAEIPRMNAYATAAASIGRDLWIVPQAFEVDETAITWRVVPNSMHAAQLGAAILAGARGVVPFMHTPASVIEGMRGPDFEPTRKLAPYLEFNSLMDHLSTRVMHLSAPVLVSSVPAPFAASLAQHQSEGGHLIVLNADDLLTRTLALTLSPPLPAAPVDFVSGQFMSLGAGGTLEVTLGPGRWALIPVGGSVVTAAIASEAPVAELSDLILPVTHQWTVERFNGQPQPVRGLQFNADATHLAVSGGVFHIEPAEPLVYRLETGGVVTRLPGPMLWNNTRTTWLPDDRVARMGVSTGMRVYRLSGLNDSPLATYLGRSGGVLHAVTDGSDYFVTQGGYGLRRLSAYGSTLVSVGESGFSSYGSFEDLFGPFADGSVTLVSLDSAVRNAKAGALFEDSHVTMPISRLQPRASLNRRNLLAVPRISRGAVLVQLSATGEPLTSATIAAEANEVTAAAWVSDDVLALADGAYHVRFYRVRPDGRSALVGRWRPPVAGPLYLRAVAAAHDRLAVGLEDGRVFVVDAANVGTLNASASGWELLE
jgi:hypothetical protein